MKENHTTTTGYFVYEGQEIGSDTTEIVTEKNRLETLLIQSIPALLQMN